MWYYQHSAASAISSFREPGFSHNTIHKSEKLCYQLAPTIYSPNKDIFGSVSIRKVVTCVSIGWPAFSTLVYTLFTLQVATTLNFCAGNLVLG